jgi:hypothetical protein
MAAVLAGCAGAVLVAGCSTDTEGAAEPVDQAAADAALWDPCTIPDDVVVQLGLDPATKQTDSESVHFPGFMVCSWDADWYDLDVYSTAHTLDDVRANPHYRDFRDVTVGGRSAVLFRDEQGTEQRPSCDVAFDAAQGAVFITVNTSALVDGPREDPCATANRNAAVLVPLLPPY